MTRAHPRSIDSPSTNNVDGMEIKYLGIRRTRMRVCLTPRDILRDKTSAWGKIHAEFNRG